MGKTFSTGLLTNGVFQDASNNIGIGAAPSGTYKLEVTGTAKVSSTLLVSGAATFSSSVTATGNGAYVFQGAGATTSYQAAILQNTGGNIQWGVSGSSGAFWGTGDAGPYYSTIGTGTNTALGFATNAIGRMTITSGGNVIIQNNKIYGTGEYLGAIWNSNGGNTTWTIGDTPANQTSWNLRVNTSAAKSGGGSWGDSSDGRLKKDVQTIQNALDKINKLNPVTFEWINPEEHNNQYNIGGFIAQEIKEIFPQFVNEINAEGKDKDIVGENEVVYGLTLPFKFDAYIVKAIQEQQATITSLQDRLDKAGL